MRCRVPSSSNAAEIEELQLKWSDICSIVRTANASASVRWLSELYSCPIRDKFARKRERRRRGVRSTSIINRREWRELEFVTFGRRARDQCYRARLESSPPRNDAEFSLAQTSTSSCSSIHAREARRARVRDCSSGHAARWLQLQALQLQAAAHCLLIGGREFCSLRFCALRSALESIV